MIGIKRKYATHFALAAALRKKGFIVDMFDAERWSHTDGTIVRAFFDRAWKVEIAA